MRISITLSGAKELDRTLARFTGRVRDLRPVLDRFAAEFAKQERRQFDTQGAAGGTRWAPLDPVYRRWKQKHYPGRPVMVRTGALRKSLTQRPLGIEQITRHSLTIGTDVGYARYHQLGTRRMPARPLVSMNEAARRRMTSQMQRYLVHGEL